MGAIDKAPVDKLAGYFSKLPQVDAIALGGSRVSEASDSLSDFDVYICTNSVIALETRRDIVRQLGGASVDNLDHDYFGGGDEWQNARTGTHFDLMYFGLEFFLEQLERPLVRYQPSLGYSTAFAYTVSRAEILYDPEGRFTALQAVTRAPYPDTLRENVVRYNHPILRRTISSYFNVLKKAVHRNDSVSINHHLAALMASYFDILFAVNRALHPGEKRLLQFAYDLPSLPEHFGRDVTETLTAAGESERLLSMLTRQLDALDVWLTAAGFEVDS